MGEAQSTFERRLATERTRASEAATVQKARLEQAEEAARAAERVQSQHNEEEVKKRLSFADARVAAAEARAMEAETKAREARYNQESVSHPCPYKSVALPWWRSRTRIVLRRLQPRQSTNKAEPKISNSATLLRPSQDPPDTGNLKYRKRRRRGLDRVLTGRVPPSFNRYVAMLLSAEGLLIGIRTVGWQGEIADRPVSRHTAVGDPFHNAESGRSLDVRPPIGDPLHNAGWRFRSERDEGRR